MKNVLLILCDQLRKDTLGCYGNSVCKTPNIDGIAARGTAFDRCYVANPICSPNRMSIFTGMYPRNHGTWTNGLDARDMGLMLGDHLSRQGVHTANIGKMHFTVSGELPPDVSHGETKYYESKTFWSAPGCDDFHGPYWGFEYVELTSGHTRQYGHYRKWFYEHGGTDDMFACNDSFGDPLSGTMRMPERLHCSSYIGERTCDSLRGHCGGDKPFFLVASFPDPHHPFDPPEESAARYPDDAVQEPICFDGSDLAGRPQKYRDHFHGDWHRAGPAKGVKRAPDEQTMKLWKNRRIAYTYAMVDLIDRNVGKILQTLEEQGLAEDTLVVFTSDHGELLGDHGLWKKGPFFYEGLMNVPLLVAGCGVPAGVHTDAMVSSVDIAPMICTLIGAQPMPFADGVSPFDPNGRFTRARTQCLIEYRVGYADSDTASFALVESRWKYVRHQTGEEELCDLAQDPQEHLNLTDDQHAGIRAQMAMGMLDALIATGAKGPRQLCQG